MLLVFVNAHYPILGASGGTGGKYIPPALRAAARLDAVGGSSPATTLARSEVSRGTSGESPGRGDGEDGDDVLSLDSAPSPQFDVSDDEPNAEDGDCG